MYRKYGLNLPESMITAIATLVSQGLYKHPSDAIISMIRDHFSLLSVSESEQIKQQYSGEKHKVFYLNFPVQLFEKLEKILPESSKLVVGDLVKQAISHALGLVVA